MVIDFDQHRKISSIISLLSLSKIRIGFKNNKKEKAYTHKIDYDTKKYEADCFLSLLSPIVNKGIKLNDKEWLLRKTN